MDDGPRPSTLVPIAAGLVAGALGAAWILRDYTEKGYALGYHVPLAIVFTAALVDATIEALRTRRWGFHYAAGLAGALITGRMIEDWPISGHGILGLLLAVAPLRAPFRICGLLIAFQAVMTKLVRGEAWPAVIWGAACGVALGLLGRWLDRIRPAADGAAARRETAR
jgi:hypothetical protein